MNKKFLLVAAICAAMSVSGFAQENLVKSAVASSETTNEPAKNAVDGDTGTRWQVNAEDAIEKTDEENDCTVQSGHWIYVDLGSEQEFNTLRIKWEGAYAKKFEIYTATDLDGNNNPKWGETPIKTVEESLSDFNEVYTYDLGSQKARYIKIQAVKLGYKGNWFSIYEIGVYKVSSEKILTSIEAPSFVRKGEEFTVNAKDQLGQNMTPENIEVTNATLVEGTTNKFVAKEEGKVAITVKNGDVTKTATTWCAAACETPSLNSYDQEIYTNSTEGIGISDPGWNGKYKTQKQFAIDGNNMFLVTDAGTFGVRKESVTGTDYTKLHFDIFPTKDVENAYVKYEGAGAQYENLTFSVKAGQWNHVTLNVAGATAYNSWIQINLGKADAENPDILVDNVYLEGEVPVTGIVVDKDVKDANGFVKVKGTLDATSIATLESKDYAYVAAFDLTGITVNETVGGINFANPNAMILVAGTVEETNATPTNDWGTTKNVVVKRNDGYYFPVKQLELVDSNTPVYTDFFISANTIGYKYTRHLPANSYATAYLPVGATLPEGCTAYTFENGDDNNTIKLVKADNINGNTPYLLKTTSDADLTFEGFNDLDMRSVNETDKELGNIHAHGTFSYRNGNEGEYGLAPNTSASEDGQLTLKKIGNAHIVPFRAYFTVGSSEASKVKFVFDDNETGINDINADTKKAADIYSVDGRLVKKNATSLEGLDSGIYIMNGKKYVVK